MTNQPLPEFLSDLFFTIGDKSLQLFPSRHPRQKEGFQIEISDQFYDSGLIVNLTEEWALLKDSHSTTQYMNGRTTCWTQWDDRTPDSHPAVEYKQWVHDTVKEDINRMISWHISDLMHNYPIQSNLERYHKLCEDCSNLPDFQMNHHHESSICFRLLGAVHRERIQAPIEGDESIFHQFIEDLQNPDKKNIKDSYMQALQIVLHVLPTLSGELFSYVEKEIDTQYVGGLDPTLSEDTMNHFALHQAKYIAGLSPMERQLHHSRMLPLLQKASLHHIVASQLQTLPDEAEPYILKGLDIDPTNLSLLVFAEAFFLQRDNPEKLESVQTQMKKMKIPTGESANVQDWIDRYTMLCNDYQYFNPTTNTDETAPELIELEAKLNAYWMTMLSETTSLSRPNLENELCSQNRFLSSGSASYVGWMRNQQRYQEVVDFMMPLVDQGHDQDELCQGELCRLRHTTNGWGFEAFIGNGLSCFLDSQVEAHIPQALQIIDEMERHISTWSTRSSLYAFACVAARGNQLDRALKYVKQAMDCNVKIANFANDSDMVNLHDHPEFIALMETTDT